MELPDLDVERGMARRRAILGDAWVDRSMAQATNFNAEFQDFITRHAWHGIWDRPGLDDRTRRIIVLSITCAMGRWEEFELHVRAAIQPGSPGQLSPDDLKEVLMQSAVYAGVPATTPASGRRCVAPEASVSKANTTIAILIGLGAESASTRESFR